MTTAQVPTRRLLMTTGSTEFCSKIRHLTEHKPALLAHNPEDFFRIRSVAGSYFRLGGHVMRPTERFARVFGDIASIRLWENVVECGWGVPRPARRDARERLLRELGLNSGTTEHLNSVVVSAYSRLCRSACRRSSSDLGRWEVEEEVLRSLHSREILLVWSAAELIPEAVGALCSIAAESLGRRTEAGHDLIGYLISRRALRQFDGHGALDAWFRAVARHAVRSSSEAGFSTALSATLVSTEESPADAVVRGEAEAAVRQALACVPPEARRLLLRRFICGWTYRAIADAGGLKHHFTAQRSVRRALSYFFERLRGTRRSGAIAPTLHDLVTGCGCRESCPESGCRLLEETCGKWCRSIPGSPLAAGGRGDEERRGLLPPCAPPGVLPDRRLERQVES